MLPRFVKVFPHEFKRVMKKKGAQAAALIPPVVNRMQQVANG